MPQSIGGRRARPRDNGATLGFEAKLWQAADALRNNMDAAEYKHVVLGLIFLKYISDAFEAKHAELDALRGEGAEPEDPDEYRAENIFWVPPEARWSYLKAAAPQPTIGQIVDDAMAAIERDNPSLKSVLPKDYARPGLDKQRLGQLINLVSDIGLGSPADRARDILGRVYEYFLSQFASAEGKKGGQFYTPTHVVRVLVEMLAPYKGRVYDPCCGSGGMFVQSEKFIEAHSGRIGDISIYGQESNYTTWRLAKMNLAIRGIDAQIAHGDSFHNDQHPDLKADYVLANPPFNDSDWRGELLRNDKRWVFGAPPSGNANFAWVQHFIHHLAPTGTAGFVLANGSMSSNQSGEGEIRKAIVEGDLVDCMVALPGQLFYATPIPVCLWFLTRDKRNSRFRDRRGETLFIDARKLGTMVDRVHRELTDVDIAKIAGTYHAWRGTPATPSPSMGEGRDGGEREYADGTGLLQIGDARRHSQARPRPDPRPLRRRRRSRRR
jgi:type I restriction enzyme M protein